MMKLSKNALVVLKKRYLLKNDKGKVIETPQQLFRRVAKAIAKPDLKYNQNPKKAEKEFFDAMSNLDFLPNSPTLMNAGTSLGQLAACFVLPIEDSIDSIFESLKDMAIIHQSGGGTGFNFSNLRPEGDLVRKSKGKASGPVSFMEIYDKSTEIIKQGGKRRGANMGILNVDHPDILKFTTIKQKKPFNNFNLSVGITKKFMEAVIKNKSFELINPRTKKSVQKIKARKIFDAIVDSAWKTGDPGMIFFDEINAKNKLKLGRITTTNPCGEQPLYYYESCNLGSINLSSMAENGKINFEKLRKTVHIAVHFLDNVIDANNYPLPIIEKISKANRKIGLGVMGFADLLIKLGVSYDSNDAVKIAGKIMKFINDESKKASERLAKQRGAFPNLRKSICRQKIRNATTTTIAPTGSISIIADSSSGIEPLFALSYMKKVMGGAKLYEYCKPYKEALRKYKGKLPEEIKKIFKTACQIKPEQHVKIQAEFQKYTDNAVSKTVNLPNKAARNDVAKVFMLAYKSKCKGITVFREGSKKEEAIKICEVCN